MPSSEPLKGGWEGGSKETLHLHVSRHNLDLGTTLANPKQFKRMADSDLRDWPPGPSDFRLACEECHKRKIRCEAPQDGPGPQGACQACRVSHRTCLFSLKNKTGRPRKAKPTHLHQAPKTLSPQTLQPHLPGTGVSASACTITSPNPRGPRRDWASRTRQHVTGHRRPSAAGHYETPNIHPHHAGSASSKEAPLGQLPWLTACGNGATGRNDFDPLLDSPCGGEIQVSMSPGFVQLEDDFVLEMPEVMTPEHLHLHVPDSSCNERPGSELGRLERLHNIGPGTTTPSTGESSGGGDYGDFWRTGPAPNSAGALGDHGDSMMSGDFFDTMRLCNEMNNVFQSRALDVTTRADQRELSVVLAHIEELGYKTTAVMRDAANLSGLPSRQERYKRMLMRATVLGAVDTAADLVKHNLSIHNIQYSTVCGGAENDGSPDSSTPDLPRESRDGKDHDGVGGTCINSSAESLETVLSLVRLDYALLQFSRFLSANQCEGGDGCHDPSGMAPGVGHDCPMGGGTSMLAKTAHTRAQLWALAKGIRKLW